MEQRPSLWEVTRYECSLLRSAWRGFWQQEAKHLRMEGLVVLAALLAPLALLILELRAFDGDLYLDAAIQGLMTALIFALLLFGWWLFTEGCRRYKLLQGEAAKSEQRAVQAESQLELRANELELKPGVAPFPFIGLSRGASDDFIIHWRRYKSLVLRVRNESGAEIPSLLATTTYYPAAGEKVAVDGRWQETGMRTTALAFGETEAVLIAYSCGDPPTIYSAGMPADVGVDSFVDRWSLGSSALVRVRLTANGLDQQIDLSLTFEHSPISDEMEARIVQAPSGAVDAWSPTPPPMTTYDIPQGISWESSWKEIGESFGSLQPVAEDVRLHISSEDDAWYGELSGRVSRRLLKGVHTTSAIAGQKLNPDLAYGEESAQCWFRVVAKAARGGSTIGQPIRIDGRTRSESVVSYFVAAAKSLCLYRAAQEGEESDK